MKKKYIVLYLILLGLIISACAGQPDQTNTADLTQEAGVVELTVMTHDSFSVSESVIAEFESANQARVRFLKSGDTGAALNRAILASQPLADVFFGVDNAFLSRALEADLFEPYDSPGLEHVPGTFKLDPENRALPVDYGDVCINYDKAYFEQNDLPLPQSLQDLTDPIYKGLLVVENPATSSPGLSFLFATISQFGEEGYLDYWKALRENDVVVVNDWETAYYANFSASSGQGPQPMVVSYGSSPPAEVIYASEPLDDSPTASLVGPNMCFRQIEFVGILKGTQNRALAEKFIDFMLGLSFQEDLPLQMFVFPVHSGAALPAEFVLYAQIPDQPASLDPDLIAKRREQWIQNWDEAVLR